MYNQTENGSSRNIDLKSYWSLRGSQDSYMVPEDYSIFVEGTTNPDTVSVLAYSEKKGTTAILDFAVSKWPSGTPNEAMYCCDKQNPKACKMLNPDCFCEISWQPTCQSNRI
jgi:hypothetical protein